MTTFLNLCIKNNILNIAAKKYKSYWYEIDTRKDHSFAEKEIKNGNLDNRVIWIWKNLFSKKYI